MEKELTEVFEDVMKAAKSCRDGGADDSPCLEAMERLKSFPVSYQLLVSTQVGKRLKFLTLHPSKNIQTVALGLKEMWKQKVLEETSKNDVKNGKCGSKDSRKRERDESPKANTPRPEKVQKTTAVKVDRSHMQVDPCAKPSSEKADGSESGTKDSKVEDHKIVKTVIEGTTKRDVKNGKYGSKDSRKRERDESPKANSPCRPEKVQKTASLKVEKVDPYAKPSSEKADQKVVKVEKVAREVKKPEPGPPRLTSMPSANDQARDKVRGLLHEALSKVSKESQTHERFASDPIRVAVKVESVLFYSWGLLGSKGSQNAKYRSLMFNLKDPKNPDFRRKVLVGEIKAERLVDMSSAEMASDERQSENKKLEQNAIHAQTPEDAPKATTDQFKCGRCGKRKTTYYQMQTRSADEPMTTYVTCVNCNNRWKFC